MIQQIPSCTKSDEETVVTNVNSVNNIEKKLKNTKIPTKFEKKKLSKKNDETFRPGPANQSKFITSSPILVCTSTGARKKREKQKVSVVRQYK